MAGSVGEGARDEEHESVGCGILAVLTLRPQHILRGRLAPPRLVPPGQLGGAG